MNKYYVYTLLDPRKPGTFKYNEYTFDHEPFYVGKGQGTRIYAHTSASELNRDHNPHKERKIRKILMAGLRVIALKVADSLSEDEAFELEKQVINLIGRTNHGGCLTNIDPGGRTTPSLTVEQKKKISDTIRHQFQSGERIHPWVGRHHSPEARQRIAEHHSNCWFGKIHTPDTKAKMSAARHGKPILALCNTYEFISPDRTVFTVMDGLQRFCEAHDLFVGCIRKVIAGTRNHHKGWVARRTTTVNPGKAI